MREISDIMHERSVLIYNLKKDALEKGDEALKHQIGEGRDIMSILCEYIWCMHMSMYPGGCPRRQGRAGRAASALGSDSARYRSDMGLGTVRENMKASEQDKLPDDELIGQVSYVPPPYSVSRSLG